MHSALNSVNRKSSYADLHLKCNLLYRIPVLQLIGAVDDDNVRAVLISDEGMEILQEIGYKGVPHRENKSSVNSIIQ